MPDAQVLIFPGLRTPPGGHPATITSVTNEHANGGIAMPTLESHARHYLNHLQGSGQLAVNSATVEAVRLRSLPGWTQPVEALTPETVTSWVEMLSRFKPAARRSYVGAARRFLRWLHSNGHTPTDLSRLLPRVREPRGVPRALPTASVAAIAAYAPSSRVEWLCAAVALMVSLGLRCVEVSRLDIDDYDPEARTVHVRGKGGHQRVLPVPSEASIVLDGYLRCRGVAAGPLLLATGSKAAPDGRLSPAWISRRTARLMAQAGVHKPGDGRSAHALRHTAASDVLDRCHDLRIVQQMLGHQSLATTERYLRVADLDRMRQAMAGRPYAS